MTDSTSPRTIRARRLLTLGTAAVGIAAPGIAGAQPPVFAPSAYHSGTGLTADLHLATSKGEGEGSEEAVKLMKKGEGEGSEHSEAEGEGDAHAEAEGEGAEHSKAEGEGEGAEHSKAEGEGEGAEHSEAEGEGDEHAEAEGEGSDAPSPKAEGESEGGSGEGADDVAFLRDLGFMTGHMRAGLALYEAGDVAAARTHMGHPIEEKFAAVEEGLEQLGKDDLRADIEALAAATEAQADPAEVSALFDAVIAKVESARDAARAKSEDGARDQLLSLAALTRIAAAEYAVGVEGGRISNLHEYQDSWGFLRTVEAEAAQLSQDGNADVAKAASRIAELVAELDAAFGDLQGQGDMTMDPSLLYGAAARMELAALAVR